MTHRLATNYEKNYCNRTLIVKVIVENVVTCFFGTRCISAITRPSVIVTVVVAAAVAAATAPLCYK